MRFAAIIAGISSKFRTLAVSISYPALRSICLQGVKSSLDWAKGKASPLGLFMDRHRLSAKRQCSKADAFVSIFIPPSVAFAAKASKTA